MNIGAVGKDDVPGIVSFPGNFFHGFVLIDLPNTQGEDKDTSLFKKSGRPSPGRPQLCVSPSKPRILPYERIVCIRRANSQI